MPTGATDPQVSRRCRARLRVRPRRPEEWQAGVARVCSPSPRVLDWQRLYYRLVSKPDVGLQPNVYCTDRPVVTRRAFRGNFPTGPETAGRSRVTSTHAHRAPRELFRARTREPARERRGARFRKCVGLARSFAMSAPEDEKHVTFSEADDGVGNLRRVPTGGAGELASAAEVAASAGMDSAVDASTDSLQVRVQNHPSASTESRARFRRTAHRPFETATMRRGTWHPAARGFSPRARGSRRAPHAEFHARFPRRLPAPPPSPRRSSPSPRLTSPRPRKRPRATKNQRLPSRATARTRRRRRTRRWTRRTVR